MTDVVSPTKFQQAVLRFRGHCNILNAGGRGSGKSFSLILDILDHCRILAQTARPLVLRETHAGLQELRNKIYELGVAAFGPTVSLNKSENVLYVPNGARVSFSNLGDEDSYGKLQGRSFTGIYADEVGNYPPQAFSFLRRTISNLRVPPGHRPAIHWTANPHGRSHSTIFKQFVSRSPPWQPFYDQHGMLWVWTTSTLEDNPYIDRTSYERNLRAACGSDEKLADAWIRGDWTVLGGVMFDLFEAKTHVIKPPASYCARLHVGGDWGSAAPAVALLIGALHEPIGHYRQGDYLVLDEVHTADPTDLSVGLGHPPQMFAEQVQEMLARNNQRKSVRVTIDDARGLQGDTVVRLMREAGLNARRPFKKDRVGTWNLIRQLLHNSRNCSAGQGLWIADRCTYLVETLPEAPRGTLRAEDIDPKWNRDHALDALGYGLRAMHGVGVTFGRVIGMPS